jgi:hypothetical protein
MLYSLGTFKAVNRNDRFTSTPAVCATHRTEVEISAPVARTVDIGFFRSGADP